MVIYQNQYLDIKSFYNLLEQNDLDYFFNKYGPDSIFMRINTLSRDMGFNNSYFSDITEKYFLYTKKYCRC